jgi:hypothetical protein
LTTFAAIAADVISIARRFISRRVETNVSLLKTYHTSAGPVGPTGIVRYINGWSHFLIRPEKRINCWHAAPARHARLHGRARGRGECDRASIRARNRAITASGPASMPNRKPRALRSFYLIRVPSSKQCTRTAARTGFLQG